VAIAQWLASADLRGALAPVHVKNRLAITEPREVAQLLRAIHGYRGHPVVEAAFKLAPLVFVRPGELRAAYNRAQRLDERRKMMQARADYLDVLRTGSNVVPFRAKS